VYDRRGDAGLVGRVGRTARPIALDELAERTAKALGGSALRVAGERARPIERVAVAPGAGTEVLDAAADARADAIVTGDVPHHRVRRALERGLAVVDPGHVATERPGLARLLEWLRELAPDCRSLLDLDPDPWEDRR
jgi:putative NIF3 family GTP cyclohydrolase 1 type 2